MSQQKAPVIDVDAAPSSSSDGEWSMIPTRIGRPMNASSKEKNVIIPIPQSDIESARSAVRAAVVTLKEVLDREGFWERYASNFCESKQYELRGYGIGSPSNSNISCFQLAMLILIKEKTRANINWCFDPVMNDTDMIVISEYGIDTALRDEDCHDVSSSCPVILFMPHCDRTLYEWILATRFPVLPAGSFLISNWFSAYSIQHKGWEEVLKIFTEKPFLIFKKDFERLEDKHQKIKHRAAEKSTEIPYQAFNDLAFVSTDEWVAANFKNIFVKIEES